jgi:hypothetical protein
MGISRTPLTLALSTLLVALAATPAAATPGPPDTSADPTNTWPAALSTIDDDDVNVAWSTGALRIADPADVPDGQRAPIVSGMLVLAPHTLAIPANQVRAFTTRATAGTDVEYRGQAPDGTWSEWTPAGTSLATDVATVGHVVLVAAEGAPPPAQLAAVGNVYRVYATREGLVGGTTANGHVIASRDHFVALPSRRGLAPKGTGDYTVRVCTTTASRCEFAPVWDVGPWNTTDDYWNPAATRQSWKDLPQGRPEAQAAYQSGYNGGKDQFGRTVANPAGIDLADGVFWDGLLLTDNSWVDVAYLWTATGVRGTIGSGPLNIRAGAGTSFASQGYAATYAKVPIECWVTGQSVAGPYATTTRWDRVGTGQYISHAYVSATTGGTAPAC